MSILQIILLFVVLWTAFGDRLRALFHKKPVKQETPVDQEKLNDLFDKYDNSTNTSSYNIPSRKNRLQSDIDQLVDKTYSDSEIDRLMAKVEKKSYLDDDIARLAQKVEKACRPQKINSNVSKRNFKNVYNITNNFCCCKQEEVKPKSNCNGQRKFIICDTNKVHCLSFKKAAEVRLTAVAGGGAGGIGFIKAITFINGAGGSAGEHMEKLLHIDAGTIMEIKLGKGGDAKLERQGEPTSVKIKKLGKIEDFACPGGRNGHPYLSEIVQVNQLTVPIDADQNLHNLIEPGKLDNLQEPTQNGQPGSFSLPSFPNLPGGGGCSSQTGTGGSPIVTGNERGCGDKGSGGGGSIANDIDLCKEKLSGCGGDGYAIVEILEQYSVCLEDIVIFVDC